MRIKIVSRPYPPNTPQIILDREAELRAAVEYVPGILRKVAKRYRDLLIHNVTFKGKLQSLPIEIIPFFGDSSEEFTHAIYSDSLAGEKHGSTVRLYVNISDSPKYIAYVFAHELSHMVMSMNMDLCRMGDRSNAGCSPGASCVIRQFHSKPELFGLALEESIADSLAMYVVSKCCFLDKEGTYAQRAPIYYHLREFAPLLASAFGVPLTRCNYIDEFTVTPVSELSEELPKQDRAEQNDGPQFIYTSIHNLFWYAVVVNQFHFIVDAYNETMGEGAWRELCCHMDAVYDDIEYNGAVGKAAAEHQRMAEEQLKDFALKYAADKENEK